MTTSFLDGVYTVSNAIEDEIPTVVYRFVYPGRQVQELYVCLRVLL